MTSLGLCGLLSLVASPVISGDALAPYRGQPVLSVDVYAPEEDIEELRSLIDIQPGFLLSTDDIQAALKRLYALGRFSDVGVTAERLSGTVSLHFYVRPIRRLERLDIEGTDQSDTKALRSALRLEPGAEVDSRTASAIERRGTKYLRRAGFPDASVEIIETSPPDAQQVSLVARVREGTPIRVTALRFTGRPRVARRVLLGIVETAVGGILNEETVTADSKRLAEEYRRHGFLRAVVEPPRIFRTGVEAEVTFSIRAGDRVRIEIHGARLLTYQDLMKLWPASKTRLESTDLDLFTARVRESYRRLGYFEAEVSLRTTRDLAHEQTIYIVTVEEGQPYRVVALQFPGAKAIRPKLLTAQVHSYLRRELVSDRFFQRLRASDACLAWPRGLSNPSLPRRGCPRPLIKPEFRWIPDLYNAAIEEITAAYRDLGFISARVGPAEATVDKQHVIVRIPVNEGPQTRIQSLAFRGNEAFSAAELLETVELASHRAEGGVPQRPGAPYSMTGLEDARIAILRNYRDFGYLYAHAFVDANLSKDRRHASVIFRLEEGPQVRIQRILVRGNRYTRDALIRSRLTMAPGDIYRLDQALADQRSIAALGVFSSVRVKLIDEEKPSEQKDVVADVVERNRQPFEIRVGASSADGPRMRVSYSHINVLGTASAFTTSARFNRQVFFDLYGDYSDSMLARYEDFDLLSQLEREVRLGVQSPRLKTLPFDLSARIDLVHERKNAISYSLDSISAILGLDFSPVESLTFGIEPQISLTNLDCVPDLEVLGEEQCSREGRRNQAVGRAIDVGLRRTFEVSPSVSFDRRDNPFNPTRGYHASLKGVYAVGRSTADPGRIPEEPFSFTKIEGTLTGYLPAGGLVLALSARAGLISLLEGNVPIDERFFLGGRGTLRGFPEGGTVIPDDACVVYQESGQTAPAGCLVRTIETPPLTEGGDFFLLFKAEARVPLPFSESLSLGVFVDFGNLWNEPPAADELAFRVGAGFGLRYATPVGPLALDLGINTNPRQINGEPTGPLPHFSVGVF